MMSLFSPVAHGDFSLPFSLFLMKSGEDGRAGVVILTWSRSREVMGLAQRYTEQHLS